MAQYELMYIVRPDLDEEKLEAAVTRISQIVQQAGGADEAVDRWGRRRLSYPIGGFDDGVYVVDTFTGNGPVGNEITRLLKIDEDVIRSIVVRTDAE